MMLVDCRTLGRLRYMTTKEIVAGFFATPTVGRRRIRRLSGLDLIASHRKGVPDELQYFAWRLTPRGLAVVAEGFPGRALPKNGLAERVAEGSLRNIEHRQQLSRQLAARGHHAGRPRAFLATRRRVRLDRRGGGEERGSGSRAAREPGTAAAARWARRGGEGTWRCPRDP